MGGRIVGRRFDPPTFRLGWIDQINWRAAQEVMFFVPSETYVPAWYTSWIHTETGDLLQEAMISRGQSMPCDFDQFGSVPGNVALTD